MLFRQFVVLITFLSITVNPVSAQVFHRFKADFSIKEVDENGRNSLKMGTVYFDKSINKIVYELKFPQKLFWIVDGENLYKVDGTRVLSKETIPKVTEMSIFYLAMENKLLDYGLSTSGLQMVEIKQENELTVSTWEPEEKNKQLSKIVLAQEHKRVHTLVFYTPKNTVASKLFFSDYKLIKDINFPCEIISQSFAHTSETYKVTTFRNIQIDDFENDQDMYNFVLPH